MTDFIGTAERVTWHQARRAFNDGRTVLVSEHGERPTCQVWSTSTTHTRDSTTWTTLAEQVRMWSNRYPRQRFYVLPATEAATV